jgi:chromate transporter
MGKVGQKALHGKLHFIMAAIAFVCIFFYNISLLTIIIGTIILALIARRFWPTLINTGYKESHQEEIDEQGYFINKYTAAPGAGFETRRLLKQLATFLLFWIMPFVPFYFLSGDFSFWKILILFFTQTAFFTLGGSYTVLPYVAQFAVAKFGWLSKMQMVDGFALAETTPGPLIIVVTFVGFMAGYNHFHGSLLMGAVGLLATTYYTFLPCFLFIFVGGPVIEKTHGNAAMADVLGLVTAAVVGVILNLTIFLGKDVIFPGGVLIKNIDVVSLAWILVSLFLMLKVKLNVVYLIILSLAAGLLRYFIGW